MKTTTDIDICFLRARHPRAIHSRMGRGNLRWRLVAALALALAAALSLVVACGSDSGVQGGCEGAACEDARASEGSVPTEAGSETSATDGGADALTDAGDASDTGTNCTGPAGTLDPTFGDGGIVWLKYPSSGAYALATQTDGKLVVGGYTGGSGGNFAVVRVLPNGATDPSFGTGGLVETKVGNVNLEVHGLAVQPDGRIVAAGFSRPTGGRFRFVVLRYSSSGTLDPTFGTGGVVETPLGNREAYARSLALQPDGKILVAGYSEDAFTPDGTADFEVVRYLADGSIDASFGTGGRVTIDMHGTRDELNAVAIGPGGKVLVAGYSSETGDDPIHTDVAVVQLDSSGALDTTFGIGGLFLSAFGGRQRANSLAFDPSGRVVLGGLNGTGSDFGIFRLTTAGALDPSFGDGGAISHDFAARADGVGFASVEPSGRILAVGSSIGGPNSGSIAAARYASNGAPDPSFGEGGIALTAPPPNADIGGTATLLTGCSYITVGAWSYDNDTVPKTAMGIARFRR